MNKDVINRIRKYLNINKDVIKQKKDIFKDVIDEMGKYLNIYKDAIKK